MTASTANEQRIAALECQVVAMRKAMEFYADETNYEPLATDIDINIDSGKRARSALSSSTDYANKVVVDSEGIHEVTAKLEKIRTVCYSNRDGISAVDQHVHTLATNCIAHLDSLRQGGGHG